MASLALLFPEFVRTRKAGPAASLITLLSSSSSSSSYHPLQLHKLSSAAAAAGISAPRYVGKRDSEVGLGVPRRNLEGCPLVPKWLYAYACLKLASSLAFYKVFYLVKKLLEFLQIWRPAVAVLSNKVGPAPPSIDFTTGISNNAVENTVEKLPDFMVVSVDLVWP